MRSASPAEHIEGWGYPILLALLLGMFVVQPWAGRSLVGSSLVQLMYSAILVGALVLVSYRRWLKVCGALLVVAGVVLGNVASETGGLLAAAGNGCALAVLLIVIGTFLADVFKHPRITVGTICGSICVFVLIGIAWMLMYGIGDLLMVDAFNGLSPRGGPERAGELFYFSFVTLTTLGYGDITPARPEMMSLATLEAVVGQLYLVVLVATFVGRRGETVSSSARKAEGSS